MFDIDATLAIEFWIAVITEFGGVGVGFSTQPASPGVTLDEFLAPQILDRRSVDPQFNMECWSSPGFRNHQINSFHIQLIPNSTFFWCPLDVSDLFNLFPLCYHFFILFPGDAAVSHGLNQLMDMKRADRRNGATKRFLKQRRMGVCLTIDNGAG